MHYLGSSIQTISLQPTGTAAAPERPKAEFLWKLWCLGTQQPSSYYNLSLFYLPSCLEDPSASAQHVTDMATQELRLSRDWRFSCCQVRHCQLPGLYTEPQDSPVPHQLTEETNKCRLQCCDSKISFPVAMRGCISSRTRTRKCCLLGPFLSRSTFTLNSFHLPPALLAAAAWCLWPAGFCTAAASRVTH